MADIAERQLMKPTGVTNGTDTYKGITKISYRRNPRPTYGVLLEGDLEPTRNEQIASDSPAVSGQIYFSGPNLVAQLDTLVASLSMTARDVTGASGTETIAFTNFQINGYSGGVSNRTVDGYVYEFVATAVSETADP